MKPPFRTRDELVAWVDQLPAADCVAICRMLSDTHTTGALSALADETVYEATRTAKAAEVAETMGLTGRQVQRAVANHLARTRAVNA